jgi:hypothetical protein
MEICVQSDVFTSSHYELKKSNIIRNIIPHSITVELGYNFMEGTQYFVSL